MKIGLVYALVSEIKSMLALCGKYEEKKVGGISFFETEKGLVFATVGMGKVNASYGTALLCQLYHPDLIINAGVAGSFEQFSQDTVLIADKCVQHDMDTSPIGDPKYFVSTVCMIEFPCDLVERAVAFAEEQGVPYSVGTVATGDAFMVDSPRSREVKKELSPLACEMEACAVAQVCRLQKVKFLALKAASDCIFKEDSNGQYHTNLAQAAENLNRFVLAFAESLLA